MLYNNSANEAEVGAGTYGLAVSPAETAWFVYFIKRTGGTQATFTVVNLTANASYGRVPCCAAAVSLSALCCHGVFRHQIVTQHRRSERKGTVVIESASGSA